MTRAAVAEVSTEDQDRDSDRDLELIACLEAVAKGNFSLRPSGGDPLSATVRDLIDNRVKSVTSALDHLVDQAVTANETAIASGSVISSTREANSRAQQIAAAMEELVASIREIDHSAKDAASFAQNVAQTAETGKTAVSAATETMEVITTVIGDAHDKVNRLAEASEHIEEFVSTIEKIASQTNLLALNATIEAARAGEAGKGFAVVANEVKRLSQQTASATLDIRERIERLTNETADIVSSMSEGADAVRTGCEVMGTVDDGMNEISARVDEVNTRMNEISGILAQQNEASTEVAKGVTTIVDLSETIAREIESTASSYDRSLAAIGDQLARFGDYDVPGKVIRLAKADHIIWKKRLADMVLGRQALKADELADHHSCRLGKWYYGDLAADFRGHPAFEKLEAPHALVHKHGIEAARLFNAGDLSGALSEIQKVEEASEDVMALLEELKTAVAR